MEDLLWWGVPAIWIMGFLMLLGLVGHWANQAVSAVFHGFEHAAITLDAPIVVSPAPTKITNFLTVGWTEQKMKGKTERTREGIRHSGICKDREAIAQIAEWLKARLGTNRADSCE